MNRERIKELACVLVLILFVCFLTKGASVSDKTAAEVFEKVSKSIDISMLKNCDKAKFQKETDFSYEDFSEVIYYASDSVMEVREVMIIKLKPEDSAKEIMSALEERAEEKEKLFSGYAPEQSALLSEYVLEEKDGFVFFAVSENSEKALAAFKSAL